LVFAKWFQLKIGQPFGQFPAADSRQQFRYRAAQGQG
jgi:hypothetical protein